MNILTVLLIALGVVVLWVIVVYNKLVVGKLRVNEALSDVDVQLKRRYDLIPNLIETVKGYMKHEQSVLENVTKARAAVGSTSGNALQRAKAEDALSKTLKSLFAVAESYPDLKANTNFLELQKELADTENKIQASRRFFNTNVLDLNSKIQTFPSSIIAAIFHIKEEKFFEIEETQKEPVKVSF